MPAALCCNHNRCQLERLHKSCYWPTNCLYCLLRAPVERLFLCLSMCVSVSDRRLLGRRANLTPLFCFSFLFLFSLFPSSVSPCHAVKWWQCCPEQQVFLCLKALQQHQSPCQLTNRTATGNAGIGRHCCTTQALAIILWSSWCRQSWSMLLQSPKDDAYEQSEQTFPSTLTGNQWFLPCTLIHDSSSAWVSESTQLYCCCYSAQFKWPASSGRWLRVDSLFLFFFSRLQQWPLPFNCNQSLSSSDANDWPVWLFVCFVCLRYL